MSAGTHAPGPAADLLRLADGYLITHLLHVAAALGVAEALAEGPRSAAEVAAAVGARPDALGRVLRGLAAEGVLAEEPDGSFALTQVGHYLRRDVPGSVHGPIGVRGDLYTGAAGGLLDAVRLGGSAFEHAHGVPFFEHLARDPRREASFGASMAARSARESSDVVAALAGLGLLDPAPDDGEGDGDVDGDGDGVRTVVDVGGGSGVLLSALLQRATRATGTLLERPAAAATAV